jgi:prolyl-tRNA synthetase
MRYSKLFGKTEKKVSADMQTASHKLLYKGGYIKESTAGRYYFLPLGWKVLNKMIAIIREEMNKAGAQEMIVPTLHPLELWKETNRTNQAGFELMRLKDRRGAEFALGGTAEEMFVDLVRKYQLSYRDLPFNIYQFSTKFRDELRARGGLLRVREFIMKDAYSFDVDEESFKIEYKNMWDTYSRIYKRLGLDTFVVESDGGYIGGDYCHEFVVESEAGESKFYVNEDGTYAAHEDVAKFTKDKKNVGESLAELKVVDAVRGTTMEDGVALHNLPLWQQIKDVLFVDDKNRFILSIIRGDYDVNETKLKKLTGSIDLRHATAEEIREQLHSEPGFISPIGIKEAKEATAELLIVADDSLRTVVNAYGGANALNKDSMNMNIDRDYKADLEGDIALVQAGYTALTGGILVEKKGIEVGNIFQLGYHYTSLMKGADFTDKDGKRKPYYMGCYGIGVGRTLATIVEKYNDDKGIQWPAEIAPFQAEILALGMDQEEVKTKAEAKYQELLSQGVDVLFDDRIKVSAGEKFADADLIGAPEKIVVSNRQ